MNARPNPTVEALWPIVQGATSFSDLCRLLYGRGVFNLPYVDKLTITDALATRLGFSVAGSTLRAAVHNYRWRSR